MPATSECRGRASRRPVSGFAPDAPAAVGSAPAAVDVRSPASALSGCPGSCRTVIPSTPGAPLLRTTARNAASMLSGSQIASIRCFGGCRAFGFGRRRDHFDLSHDLARGFTPARYRQVQRELGWRSLCGHETSELLALSFNPFSGTVRAFSRRSGLLRPLLTSAPRSGSLAAPSVPKDTVQISWGKPRSLPRTPAGFTVLALDGYGLRDFLPARPTNAASYPVSVRRVAISLHASFRRSLAVPPLRFTRASPPSGCTGDFHPQAAGHAQHTGWRDAPPPLAASTLTRRDACQLGF